MVAYLILLYSSFFYLYSYKVVSSLIAIGIKPAVRISSGNTLPNVTFCNVLQELQQKRKIKTPQKRTLRTGNHMIYKHRRVTLSQKWCISLTNPIQRVTTTKTVTE